MPAVRKAPRLWPAAPRATTWNGPLISPRASAPARPAPKARSAVVSSTSNVDPGRRCSGRPKQARLDGGRWSDRDARRRRLGRRSTRHVGLPAWRAEQGCWVDGLWTWRRTEEACRFADDLAQRPGADHGQLVADILGQCRHESFDLLRRTSELGSKVFALCGDPGRAGVEVALSSHVTAERDEDGRAQTELLGAQQRRHDDVAAAPQTSVGAQGRAVAQAGAQEHLMDLRQAELPWRADVLDGAERRGAGPAGVPGDVDVGGARLDDTCGDGPDAARGDELDADPRGRVDRAKVGDELGQILDGVDVVMGRGADVGHALLPASERGDVGSRLPPGQLAAFARLRALRDLDLELLGADEIIGRHAETRRGDLLDARIASLAVGAGLVPGGVLAALAGVGRAAGSLHPDGHGLVRLRGKGANAHGRGHEAGDDAVRGLDLDERDRPAAAVAEGVANRGGLPSPERRQRSRLRGRGRGVGDPLQELDDGRRVPMRLAVRPKACATWIEKAPRRRLGRYVAGRLGAVELTRGELDEPQSAGPCGGGGKAGADDRLGQLEGLELVAADV